MISACCNAGWVSLRSKYSSLPDHIPVHMQAGVYPNVFHAARSITDAAGVRGLFTGYLPNLLEDVPDMAFKFAAYESMRSLHRRLNDGRSANAQVSFPRLCSQLGLCSAHHGTVATQKCGL